MISFSSYNANLMIKLHFAKKTRLHQTNDWRTHDALQRSSCKTKFVITYVVFYYTKRLICNTLKNANYDEIYQSSTYSVSPSQATSAQ
ncbi:unnamed protein product [Rotaria socialis]